MAWARSLGTLDEGFLAGGSCGASHSGATADWDLCSVHTDSLETARGLCAIFLHFHAFGASGAFHRGAWGDLDVNVRAIAWEQWGRGVRIIWYTSRLAS